MASSFEWDSDAVVIGAGPTGMALALALNRKGLKVLIFEKHVGRLPYSRAMFLNSHTMQLLDEFNLCDSFRKEGRVLRGVSVLTVPGNSTDASCDLSSFASSNKHHPVIIPQVKIEQVLEGKLRAVGVHVEDNMAYIGHNSTSDHVEVDIEDRATGNMHRYTCRWLFGADGFNSVVRRDLGVEFNGSTMEEQMVAADVVVHSFPHTSDLNVWIRPKGAILGILMSGNRIRLAATHTSLRDEMLALFEVERVDWISEFKLHHYHSSVHGWGRVHLAGDAVHVHSPIGGRGLNMGIADAIALAEAAAIGTEDAFLAYHTKRQPITMSWVYSNKIVTYLVSTQSVVGVFFRTLVMLNVRLLSYLGLGSWMARTAFQALSGVQLQGNTDNTECHPSIRGAR